MARIGGHGEADFNFIGWLGTALGLRRGRHQDVPERVGAVRLWAAWAGLVMVLAYMASQWRETAVAMNQRQTRLGTIALSSVVLVLGLLVAVNYLASRRNHRWDLTANQQFSLSPQTRQILEKLDSPVQVKVFDKPDRVRAVSRPAERVSVRLEESDGGLHRRRTSSR